MSQNNNNRENEELKPLNPKKYVVRKIFRKYEKAEPVSKPERKPFFTEFPIKTKEILLNIKEYFVANLGKIVIITLITLILLFFIMLFIPKTPKASFVDKLTGEPIPGYVYFDDTLIGNTDGIKFSGFPKEYCNEIHVIRLESFNSAFEWQTYPVDCKSKKVIFSVDHEKAQPSKNIVLKFLDSTGSYYIAGKLYFNDVFVQEVSEAISIARGECKNITKVKLEHDTLYNEWSNNVEFCETKEELKFRVS